VFCRVIRARPWWKRRTVVIGTTDRTKRKHSCKSCANSVKNHWSWLGRNFSMSRWICSLRWDYDALLCDAYYITIRAANQLDALCRFLHTKFEPSRNHAISNNFHFTFVDIFDFFTFSDLLFFFVFIASYDIFSLFFFLTVKNLFLANFSRFLGASNSQSCNYFVVERYLSSRTSCKTHSNQSTIYVLLCNVD